MSGETDRYVRIFVSNLYRRGVSNVVICPGSRSTPLTLSFTSDPRYQCWLHLDERSAGYFALGLARQLGEPVALVCTSGTAAANFLPAVMEASLSRVPLLVLTTDRPPELRDVGASQTVDQVRLYGSHVRWAMDMPLADGSEAVERYARGSAMRAVEWALRAPSGPVHLNFPFREPLVGPESSSIEPESGSQLQDQVWSEVEGSKLEPTDDMVANLSKALNGRRGLVICGPESGRLPTKEIVSLASELGWPVLADPLSGVRAGLHNVDHVVETYDTLLRDSDFADRVEPDVVLRFGSTPTSKTLAEWIAARPQISQYVVDASSGWRDPDSMATRMIRADPALLCEALLSCIGEIAKSDPQWLSDWKFSNEVARSALRDALDAIDEPFEGRAPVEFLNAIPDGSTLVVGNSMAIRDVDSFVPVVGRDIRIIGNRGASGIDGVVSSAVGAAAARTGKVALLLGDLSFFHDLNGLWPLRRYGLDLTVLLVNNDGGGIFHFLPQAEEVPDAFEDWFGTPHGLDFRGAVEMHGGNFQQIKGVKGWSAELTEALAAPGLSVLELRTDRHRNVELHRQILSHVHNAMQSGAEV